MLVGHNKITIFFFLFFIKISGRGVVMDIKVLSKFTRKLSLQVTSFRPVAPLHHAPPPSFRITTTLFERVKSGLLALMFSGSECTICYALLCDRSAAATHASLFGYLKIWLFFELPQRHNTYMLETDSLQTSRIGQFAAFVGLQTFVRPLLLLIIPP
jgi:hypothetical protein